MSYKGTRSQNVEAYHTIADAFRIWLCLIDGTRSAVFTDDFRTEISVAYRIAPIITALTIIP